MGNRGNRCLHMGQERTLQGAMRTEFWGQLRPSRASDIKMTSMTYSHKVQEPRQLWPSVSGFSASETARVSRHATRHQTWAQQSDASGSLSWVRASPLQKLACSRNLKVCLKLEVDEEVTETGQDGRAWHLSFGHSQSPIIKPKMSPLSLGKIVDSQCATLCANPPPRNGGKGFGFFGLRPKLIAQGRVGAGEPAAGP